MSNYKATDNIGFIFKDKTGEPRNPERMEELRTRLDEVAAAYGFGLSSHTLADPFGFCGLKEFQQLKAIKELKEALQ